MPISETVLLLMALLGVAVLAAGLCRNTPIPFTVLLVVIGAVLAEIARTWEPLGALQHLRLSPDLVFFVFLPALIFESGFNLDARQLTKDLAPVLVLAVPALLISTAVVGAGLWWLLGLAPITALLFGALISATDPVSVVALFKQLGAPQRLTVLVEGESLLNDATAIVVFGILLGLALGGEALEASALALAAVDFVRVFLGGVAVGAALGLLGSELLHRLHSERSAVLVTSIIMAYSSFILAEHVLHVSGVMAAASAAVALGVFGVTRLRHEVTEPIGETWELIALVCNSLLFLLVGLSVDLASIASRADVIGLAVALVIAARAAAVHTLVPATTRLFSLPRVSRAERHIMWWGGLKGGLAIAIALSIPEHLPGRQLILDTTLGVVLFTLLVNAPTIRPLMSRLGLDRLSDEERSELRQAARHGRERAQGAIERFRSAGLMTRHSRLLADRNLRETFEVATTARDAGRAARHLHLAALRTELEELARLYDMGIITQYTYLDIRNTLQRDRERLTAGDGDGEAPAPARRNPFVRFEMALLRRLRESDRAAGLLARYQSVRLSQHLRHNIAGILMCESVLEMLAGRHDADERDREQVARVYRERRARRRARVRTIRDEFPAFYERFETQLFTRGALLGALRQARHEHQHAEIGAKVLADVERRIARAVEDLPPITAPLPHLGARELIEAVPLLEGLPERALEALAGRAKAVATLPGDVIIGEGERGDALYVITRGRVRVTREADGTVLGELGDGDFFGETALLGDHVRTATVAAAAPSQLLRLTRREVLALAEEQPELKRRLEDAAAARRTS